MVSEDLNGIEMVSHIVDWWVWC